jgi:hypothetical protein
LSPLPWLAYWAAILPDVLKLAKALFLETGGDVGASRAAIQRMRGYVKEWYATRDKNTRALNDLPDDPPEDQG